MSENNEQENNFIEMLKSAISKALTAGPVLNFDATRFYINYIPENNRVKFDMADKSPFKGMPEEIPTAIADLSIEEVNLLIARLQEVVTESNIHKELSE